MTNNYGYIYKTTNLRNNKIYVGKRKGEFSNRYYGSGLIIKRELKEDLGSFKVELIAYGLTREQLNLLERKYIEDYKKVIGEDNLYNIRTGGSGGFSGKKHSLDTINRIRNSVISKMSLPEIKEKVKVAQKNRYLSSEERLKTKLATRNNGCKFHKKDCQCRFCR